MVNIASYAEMALRTQQARTSAIAQGAVMDEWGHHLIIMAALGSTCEMCLPWQGRVLIDDVYASGTQADGSYPLLSSAIGQGLGHSNCRHLPGSPWFPGINTLPDLPKADQVHARYEAEARQREIERNIRKYKRLETGTLDPKNQAKYGEKVMAWQAQMRDHLSDNPQLRRMPVRESVVGGKITKPDFRSFQSLGASANSDTVKLLDGTIGRLAPNTTTTKIVAFAGQGTSSPLRIAEILAERYNVNAEKWQHLRGEGFKEYESKIRLAELHWFEHEDIGRVLMKVKRWKDEG